MCIRDIYDPHAFIVVNEGVNVVGNYKTRL